MNKERLEEELVNLKKIENNHRKLNGELMEEIKLLQKKLDKAIELLIASEYKQFLINEKGKETIKECWLRYIEQELEK